MIAHALLTFVLISSVSSLKVQLPTNSFRQRFLKSIHSAKSLEFDFEHDSNKSNKLDPSKHAEVLDLVENLIADMAINTCAFYNDELQKHGFSSNIVSKTWMLGFLNYKDIGFSVSNNDDKNDDYDNDDINSIKRSNDNKRSTTFLKSNTQPKQGNRNNINNRNSWNRYIESMIGVDPLEIKVITMPQKGMFPEGSSMRMQYIQKIEPRKIAHKLLQIYESLLKELTTDVATVTREHSEALRYSTLLVKEGKEVANKNRKTVRLNFDDNDENGTPFREKNWHTLGALVTRMAVELVTADYLAAAKKTTATASSNNSNNINIYNGNKNRISIDSSSINNNDCRNKISDSSSNGDSMKENRIAPSQTLSAARFQATDLIVTDEASATAFYLNHCMSSISSSTATATTTNSIVTNKNNNVEDDRQLTRRLLESLYTVGLRDGLVTVCTTAASGSSVVTSDASGSREDQTVVITFTSPPSTATATSTTNSSLNQSHQVNVLKLTQQLIDKRCAVAEAVTNVLLTLDSTTRRYYQLIKDSGGFTKLELPRRPKYEVVDMKDILLSMSSSSSSSSIAGNTNMNSNNKNQQQKKQQQQLLFEKNKIINNNNNDDGGHDSKSNDVDDLNNNNMTDLKNKTKKDDNRVNDNYKNDSDDDDDDMFVIPMSSGYYYDDDEARNNIMFL